MRADDAGPSSASSPARSAFRTAAHRADGRGQDVAVPAGEQVERVEDLLALRAPRKRGAHAARRSRAVPSASCGVRLPGRDLAGRRAASTTIRAAAAGVEPLEPVDRAGQLEQRRPRSRPLVVEQTLGAVEAARGQRATTAAELGRRSRVDGSQRCSSTARLESRRNGTGWQRERIVSGRRPTALDATRTITA